MNNITSISLPNKNGLLKRFGKHEYMMHYNRLVYLVIFVNLGILFFGITKGEWWTTGGIELNALSNCVIANLSIAILIRQQYVINFLFWLATRAPTSWPLTIRWMLGKVYHHGGLHSGCAGAATTWFAVFTGALTYQLANNLPGVSFGVVIVAYVMLIILVLLVVVALPQIRARFHDNFELVHRFGGWTILLLFWVQTLIFTHDQKGDISLGNALLSSPGFLMLVILTISVIFPWLRLKKVSIKVIKPSSHAVIVKFNHGTTSFPGSTTPVSTDPLAQWHAFANIPSPDADGFRIAISRTGDWSGAFIDNPPSHVWVRGIPTAGVANIETLFKRVVYVATGSGVGPCLPHLLAKAVPAHLVWSTRDPRETYGDALVDEILEAEPNALIWNTTKDGRPDMVKLAYSVYQKFNAEAVICISNRKLTFQIVRELEVRGIPAYGAIWDS